MSGCLTATCPRLFPLRSDLITEVDGHPVKCQEDWDAYIKTKLPCDTVMVRLTHHGDKDAVDLKLMIGSVLQAVTVM